MPTTEVSATRPVSAHPDHRVVVYGDGLALVRAVGEFAADALTRGGAAVVLANHEDLEATSTWVQLAVGGPGFERRFVGVDRDKVIPRLLESDEPAALFEELLATVCAQLPEGVQPVHVYGDLVGTLWELGDVHAALSVEDVGTRMASTSGLSILCAYPERTLDGAGALELVSARHSEVLRIPGVPGSGSLAEAHTRIYPPSVRACRAARAFVRDRLAAAGTDPTFAEVVELVCSELAANAVRHAHSAFTVQIQPVSTGVRVAVGDDLPSGDHFPVEVCHGLSIVTALTTAWGVDPNPLGKVVWADVRAS